MIKDSLQRFYVSQRAFHAAVSCDCCLRARGLAGPSKRRSRFDLVSSLPARPVAAGALPHFRSDAAFKFDIVCLPSWGPTNAAFTGAGSPLQHLGWGPKVMLCVWWDWKGIIHDELLPPGSTIDSELYYEQLMRLKQVVEGKRPELIYKRGVVFHHDNARPYTSLATQQKLREFCWEVLMYPPYSPDLTPSDFHLFRSLQNSLGSVSTKLHVIMQVSTFCATPVTSSAKKAGILNTHSHNYGRCEELRQEYLYVIKSGIKRSLPMNPR
ncbi:jg7678 [Pararge aegeria aegeria]|uniref:Jg7678 protein n=1 Tax=Pararge aegeria aegeria TaxID=348720 RepID=A0A8S4S9B3_9NEOP|nr:jg7678 [Pararge aegeria aegeria]